VKNPRANFRVVFPAQLTGFLVEGDKAGERGEGMFEWVQSCPLEVQA